MFSPFPSATKQKHPNGCKMIWAKWTHLTPNFLSLSHPRGLLYEKPIKMWECWSADLESIRVARSKTFNSVLRPVATDNNRKFRIVRLLILLPSGVLYRVPDHFLCVHRRRVPNQRHLVRKGVSWFEVDHWSRYCEDNNLTTISSHIIWYQITEPYFWMKHFNSAIHKAAGLMVPGCSMIWLVLFLKIREAVNGEVAYGGRPKMASN